MRRTGRSRSSARSTGSAPPAAALEAIERFVRVLARTGLSARELASACRNACERIPEALTRQGRREIRKMIDAPHIVTLWFSDPDFLDAHGKPLALSVRGRGPSIAGLLRRVNKSLDPTETIRYLLKANALKRAGGRYLPRGRAIRMRGTGPPLHERNLRPLVGMLRTLEHNGRPHHEARSWFEQLADNPRVPVRDLAEIDAMLDKLGVDFARTMDALMHRAERARRGNEPTVRLGIGVYRFEGESPAADTPPRRRRRSRRRKARTRQ